MKIQLLPTLWGKTPLAAAHAIAFERTGGAALTFNETGAFAMTATNINTAFSPLMGVIKTIGKALPLMLTKGEVNDRKGTIKTE